MDNIFENYLAFIESELNIQLLPYQKEILRKVYEGKQVYYMPARYRDRCITLQGLELLTNLMNKENVYEK